MPEAQPTTYMTFEQLYNSVGLRILKTSAPTSDNLTLCKAWVNEGYMEFLRSYDWSFLKPKTTLSVTAADYDIALPLNFGGLLESPINSTSTGYNPLKEWPVDKIRSFIASEATTGDPVYYAIEPITFAVATGQQWQMLLYPIPSSSFTLTYRYRIVPDLLATAAHYPMGGGYHSYAILMAACMMAEESQGRTDGFYHAKFQAALQKSIEEDLRYRARDLGSVIPTQYGSDDNVNNVSIVEF